MTLARKDLLKECLAQAHHTEAGVKNYVETVTMRYRFIPAPPGRAVVRCQWHVRYYTTADTVVSLISAFLALISGIHVDKYRVMRFETYHEFTEVAAEDFIRKVTTRSKRKPLIVFLLMLSGAFCFFTFCCFVYQASTFSSNLPSFIGIEMEIGMGLLAVVDALFLLAFVLVLRLLIRVAYWYIPPDTANDLNSRSVILEQVGRA